MTENEARQIVHAALRCGALSAESACGVVQLAFQTYDGLMNESAYASVTVTSAGLSISEMRSNRTRDAIQWESKLAQVLAGLDQMRMSFSRPIAA